MKRDYKLYIDDIRESIKQIEIYMNNITQEQFRDNKQLEDAVIKKTMCHSTLNGGV